MSLSLPLSMFPSASRYLSAQPFLMTHSYTHTYGKHPHKHFGCRMKVRHAMRKLKFHQQLPVNRSDPGEQNSPIFYKSVCTLKIMLINRLSVSIERSIRVSHFNPLFQPYICRYFAVAFYVTYSIVS